MRYLIALGGDYELISHALLDFRTLDYDYVWAVDRGLVHLHHLHIVPNQILGDMDSVAKTLLEKYADSPFEIRKFPRSKDFTDGEAAFLQLRERLNSGDEVYLLGAMGADRLDHQANIAVMAEQLRSQDVNIILTNGRAWMYLLRAQQPYLWTLDKGKTWPAIISLLAAGEDVIGINTRGLAYALHDEDLLRGESRGISNLPCADCKEIEISYKKGLLNVYFLYTDERSIFPVSDDRHDAIRQ